MARLAVEINLALPAGNETAVKSQEFALAQQMRGWFEILGYDFEPYQVWEDNYFEWIIRVPVRGNASYLTLFISGEYILT